MARGKRQPERVEVIAPQVAPTPVIQPGAATVQVRCGACRFFVGDERGVCHRFPPPNDYSPPRMPPTLSDLWCGEFEVRP